MKRHAFVLMLFIAGMLLSESAALAKSDVAVPSDDSVRTNILTALARQPTKHFHFVQEKKMALLSKPLITEGELTLQGEQRVTWNIQKPYVMRYELAPDVIREIDSNGERIIPVGNNPLAAALTEALNAAVSGQWHNKEDLADLTVTGSLQHWTLDISPHASELKKLIQHIGIEGEDALIRTITIQESNGDSTVIHLTPAA